MSSWPPAPPPPAVAYAWAHAAEFGGDPATTIVFGHSAGANMASLVTFARPKPTAGCLGGATLGPIAALVTWEGDWMAYDPRFPWDGALAADRRVLDGYTPLSYIAGNKDVKVVMLVSDDPGIERDMSDPAAVDVFFAVRDPAGDLRRSLEANGALADGSFDVIELQQLLYSLLKAQGNPVALDVMPSSTHEFIAGGGWDVFLAAFGKAAARD
jgi:acetyl esterase/lipase